jgi:hypothetical protein
MASKPNYPTGNVSEHARRAPAKGSNATGGPTIAGSKTISTGRVGQHVRGNAPHRERKSAPSSLLGSRPSQHVTHPTGAPSRHPGAAR